MLARVDTLQRHAAAFAEAITHTALRTDARALMETLQRTRAFLEDASPGPGLDGVEHVMDSISLLLASLGRIK